MPWSGSSTPNAPASRPAPSVGTRICGLLRLSLNGYGHIGLSGLELKRWERAYEAGDEEAFCHLMGPEQLVDNLGEFLGYFIRRAGGLCQVPQADPSTRSRRTLPMLFSVAR